MNTSRLPSPRVLALRRIGAVAAAGLALNLVAVSPAAAITPTAEMVTKFLENQFQQVVKGFLAQFGLGVENAVAQSGAATRAEITKKAIADKTVAEGLEAYRQQQDLRVRAQELSESLQQPATTCQTMAMEGAVGNASQSAQARMFTNQTRALARIAGNTNTVQTIESAHKATNEYLCTKEEAARGVCRLTSHSSYAKLAGADQNAAFLFQAEDGNPSYTGDQNGPQAQAADSYIKRIVSGGAPPEQLRKTDYTTNPQGRAYVELMRRYKGVMSMVSYSLNQIKEARNPEPGLGTRTMMATVNVPNFEGNKVNMSMLEAVKRFVAVKFSPDSMRDAAKATNPNLMLRDMAQMSAFGLWMEHQTLQQDSRTEAMMALQLALMTEQALRPQLDAQRRAAANAK